jgi:hypothetical protein
MKRSIFLLITAIFSILTGCIHLFIPSFIVEGNHWTSSPQIEFLLRLLGGLVFSLGVLNFLVRNHSDSDTLKAVLVCNVLNHTINLVNDILSINQGIATFKDSIPFITGHLFFGLGSLYYLMKIKLIKTGSGLNVLNDL